MSNVKIYWVLTAIMFVWGLNVSLVKILVANFDPITITSLRILTAGMCVFVILACLKEVRRPSGSEWGYILAGSLLNVVGHHYFLAEGLRETSAVNGGLILGLGPLLTALLSMFFLRRKPSYIRLSGFLLGGLGVGFTVLSGGKGLNEITSGDFYIFLSIFSQASSFILISKAVKTINPRLLTGYMLVLGSIILFVISLITEPNGIASLKNGSWSVWVSFFLSAIVATGVGHMIYNYAIGKAGAAETSIFINLSTFFSLIGAAIFLGEPIYASHFIGLLFIVSGVILGSGSLEELLLKNRRTNIEKPM